MEGWGPAHENPQTLRLCSLCQPRIWWEAVHPPLLSDYPNLFIAHPSFSGPHLPFYTMALQTLLSTMPFLLTVCSSLILICISTLHPSLCTLSPTHHPPLSFLLSPPFLLHPPLFIPHSPPSTLQFSPPILYSTSSLYSKSIFHSSLSSVMLRRLLSTSLAHPFCSLHVSFPCPLPLLFSMFFSPQPPPLSSHSPYSTLHFPFSMHFAPYNFGQLQNPFCTHTTSPRPVPCCLYSSSSLHTPLSSFCFSFSALHKRMSYPVSISHSAFHF